MDIGVSLQRGCFDWREFTVVQKRADYGRVVLVWDYSRMGILRIDGIHVLLGLFYFQNE